MRRSCLGGGRRGIGRRSCLGGGWRGIGRRSCLGGGRQAGRLHRRLFILLSHLRRLALRYFVVRVAVASQEMRRGRLRLALDALQFCLCRGSHTHCPGELQADFLRVLFVVLRVDCHVAGVCRRARRIFDDEALVVGHEVDDARSSSPFGVEILSLVGAGMRSNPGVTATFFAAMSEAGVNIEMISTSEIRISIIVREADLDRATKAAHTAFQLDADQVEAVVYGGTGR